jgi:hypothetical protein
MHRYARMWAQSCQQLIFEGLRCRSSMPLTSPPPQSCAAFELRRRPREIDVSPRWMPTSMLYAAKCACAALELAFNLLLVSSGRFKSQMHAPRNCCGFAARDDAAWNLGSLDCGRKILAGNHSSSVPDMPVRSSSIYKASPLEPSSKYWLGGGGAV